ncbi:MAG: lysophospholipid acyltransferase family protein [Enhygromyxa sp.]
MIAPDPPPGELGCYDPEHVRRHAPEWRRLLHGYFRARVHGLDRLPEGPFLAVGNHSGAGLIPDTLVWLAAYHSAGLPTPLLTLAHDQMFDSFPERLRRWVARYGAIRASRERALEALRRGYAVQVYPGGDHDACRRFRDRNKLVFAGRTGYVEIAREAGVPIVPVASVGGHETLIILREGQRLARWLGVDRRLRLRSFPLSLSIPWGLWLGPLPGYLPLPARIEIEVASPIWAHGDTAEIDARVRAILQSTIDRLAHGRRPLFG